MYCFGLFPLFPIFVHVFGLPSSSTSIIENRDSGSESSPNPIASLYPNDVSGTINSTIFLVPIPYELARSIIPPQFGILKEAYLSLLPGFPDTSYPVRRNCFPSLKRNLDTNVYSQLVIRGALDHDVGVYALNFALPDFQSIHILYPFVDILSDGYSSFVYQEYLLLTSTSTIAITGTEVYGTVVVPATFQPELEAYEYAKNRDCDPIELKAFTNLSTTAPAASMIFEPIDEVAPWPMEFYVDVTNQPITTLGVLCDEQVTMFNTSLSEGRNTPMGIIGDVEILNEYVTGGTGMFEAKGVFGVKVDIAFVEFPGSTCASFSRT